MNRAKGVKDGIEKKSNGCTSIVPRDALRKEKQSTLNGKGNRDKGATKKGRATAKRKQTRKQLNPRTAGNEQER